MARATKNKLKTHNARKCLGSLRTKYISMIAVLFISICVVLCGTGVGLSFFFGGFEKTTSEGNVRRAVASIASDIREQDLILYTYSAWNEMADALDAFLAGNKALFDSMWTSTFHSPGNWKCKDDGENFVGFYGPDGKHLYSEYHEWLGNKTAEAASPTPPWLATALPKELMGTWSGIVTLPGYPTLALSSHAVTTMSNTSGIIHGFQVWGFTITSHMQELADMAETEVPVCLSIWKYDDPDLPGDVKRYLPRLTPKMLEKDPTKVWNGTINFWVDHFHQVVMPPSRRCPRGYHDDPDSKAFSKMSLSYFILSDGFGNHTPGPVMRVDNPRKIWARGTTVMLISDSAATGAFLVACIAFVLFLEFVVLKRLRKLRKFVKSVTKRQSETFSPDNISTEGEDDEEEGRKHAGIGMVELTSASPSSSFATPSTSASSNSSSSGDTPADEIDKLGHMANSRIDALKRENDKISAMVKEQEAAIERQHDALRLLNLFCGRDNEATVAVVPDTVPKKTAEQNVAEILANPLAVGFFKAFCQSQGCLQEIMFILDVEWINDMENVLAKQQKHPKQHGGGEDQTSVTTGPTADDIAKAGKLIRSRYFKKKGEGKITISPFVMRKVVKERAYTPGMFDAAVADVTRHLNSEVLPKFRKSAGYHALQLALDVADVQQERRQSDAGEPAITPRQIAMGMKNALRGAMSVMRQIGQAMLADGDEDYDSSTGGASRSGSSNPAAGSGSLALSMSQ